MHNCDDIKHVIESYLAGELTPSEKQMLDQHLPGCPDCRSLAALHEQLVKMPGDEPMPGPDAFRLVRSRVLAQTAGARTDRPGISTARALGSAVAAAAMLVVGVFVGRWTAMPGGIDDHLLLGAVAKQARAKSSLGDYWNAPLSYTNVNAVAVDNDSVSLEFDVCRGVGLTTSRDSAIAGDVLTHAILKSDSKGERMRALELAALSGNTRLTEALLITLHHDPNPTVRMGALAALAERERSEEITRGLLASLRDDQSVQVRMLALDQLVKQTLDLDTLEETIEQGKGASNFALFQRAQALRANRATQERL